jgi:DTW domain-containing protein
VITGVSFGDEVAGEAMGDPQRPPVLLFPRPDAEVLCAGGNWRARTLVVLDATWTKARRMLAANRWLQHLPAWRLALDRPSVYTVRQEPGPGCFCTAEAVAEALAIADRDEAARDALIAPLQAMLGLQQAAEDAGSSLVLADREQLARAGYLPRSG